MPANFYLYCALAFLVGVFFLSRIWFSAQEEEAVEEVEEENMPRKAAVMQEVKLFMNRGDHVLYSCDASPVPMLVEVVELREDWVLVRARGSNRLPFVAAYTSLYIPVELEDDDTV